MIYKLIATTALLTALALPATAQTAGATAGNAGNDYSRYTIGVDDPAMSLSERQAAHRARQAADDTIEHNGQPTKRWADDDHKSMDKEALQTGRGLHYQDSEASGR